LPTSVEQYLELLDWTGRQIVSGKHGAIPSGLAPILSRLEIDSGNWLELARNFGRLFQRVAGRPRVGDRQRQGEQGSGTSLTASALAEAASNTR
jgi:hypothetical protein